MVHEYKLSRVTYKKDGEVSKQGNEYGMGNLEKGENREFKKKDILVGICGKIKLFVWS